MKNNNPWFLVSGILTILSCCAYGIVLIIAIVATANMEYIIQDMTTAQEIESFKVVMTFLLVFSICVIGISIFNSVVFFKFHNIGYEKLRNNMGLPIVAIVFSFISGNILSGVFGIVGLCVKPNNTVREENVQNDINKINTNFQDINKQDAEFENLDKELSKLSSLKSKGLITEEQYSNLRSNLINKYLKK